MGNEKSTLHAINKVVLSLDFGFEIDNFVIPFFGDSRSLASHSGKSLKGSGPTVEIFFNGLDFSFVVSDSGLKSNSGNGIASSDSSWAKDD